MADVETGIRESLNGHQVWLRIGVQTFYFQEQTSENAEDRKMSSEEYSKWYEKQLKTALDKIIKPSSTDE
jgi:hypothetical protein